MRISDWSSDVFSSDLQEFEKDGYFLTDLAVHNLGSINRLITLDNSYIELLGWPEGAPPARKEIANSPASMEALVFRSTDRKRVGRERVCQYVWLPVVAEAFKKKNNKVRDSNNQ